MAMRNYTEDSLGLSNLNEAAFKKRFETMKENFKKVGLDPLRNASTILPNPEYMKILTESVKVKAPAGASQYVLEDIDRINALYENVGRQILDESTMSAADLSPIMVNSFGIQERALISAHLPRAVKQVTAKVPDFKLTERIPYIVDLAGNKSKFIDAFVPGADGTYTAISLRDTVNMSFAVPSMAVDLWAGSTGISEGADGYRPAVATTNIFGFDSILTALKVGLSNGTNYEFKSTGAEVTFEIDSSRSPSVEDGTFKVIATWNEYVTTAGATALSVAEGTAHKQTAVIMGQFDLSNGQLVSISSTNPLVTYATFKMVLSPEAHNNALSVSYEVKHTNVNIPVGEHFEYALTEEFKDAADKYYSTDAMALLTDYMGRAVEQVKDITTLQKYQELAEDAIVKTTFNCMPVSSFSQGKEEYIRREFAPFIEKVCIILKSKVRIPDCHFRVLGNPLDIRVAASAGTEYIYKRNEQFAGEIGLDYEFSVTSDIHKIFYLSSERVPVGKIMIFLIPNTIENNISTVNHYEYATYVSNKYHNTKNNLPTVMISTRYMTKEYYPVMAVIDIINNLTDDTSATTATGTGLSNSVYAKINYVNG